MWICVYIELIQFLFHLLSYDYFFTMCCSHLMDSIPSFTLLNILKIHMLKSLSCVPYYITFLEYGSPCLFSLLTFPAVVYFSSCSATLTVGSPSAGELFAAEVPGELWIAVRVLCFSLPALYGAHQIQVSFLFYFTSFLVHIQMQSSNFLHSTSEWTPPIFCIPRP